MPGTYLAPLLWITGGLTAAASVVCIVPHLGLRTLFGSQTSDEGALTLIRHWGILVGLIGLLLMCAAQNVEIRAEIMTVAAVEKTALSGMIFLGRPRRKGLAIVAAVVDGLMALLLFLCLLST